MIIEYDCTTKEVSYLRENPDGTRTMVACRDMGDDEIVLVQRAWQLEQGLTDKEMNDGSSQ